LRIGPDNPLAGKLRPGMSVIATLVRPFGADRLEAAPEKTTPAGRVFLLHRLRSVDAHYMGLSDGKLCICDVLPATANRRFAGNFFKIY
jgi:hypothetical protein